LERMYSVTFAPCLVTPKGLERICAIGHSPPQILLGHTVRQTSTVFYLIYDYITVLYLCGERILEFASNFSSYFLLKLFSWRGMQPERCASLAERFRVD
jgi:hypothetical protein